jgi:large subunit ribosomal protein L29
MKAADLRLKDIPALEAEVSSLLKTNFALRMQKATQQLSNNQALSKIRKDVARIRTIISEKQKEASI